MQQNVSITDGGQAIVGNVTRPRPRLKKHAAVTPALADSRRRPMKIINERQRAPDPLSRGQKNDPSAQHRPDAREPALRGQDTFRRTLYVAGGQRQEPLPHARRRAGNWRASRQSKRTEARTLYLRSYRRTPVRAVVAAGIASANRENTIIVSYSSAQFVFLDRFLRAVAASFTFSYGVAFRRSYAWSRPAVLVDEFDAGRLEGIAIPPNR